MSCLILVLQLLSQPPPSTDLVASRLRRRPREPTSMTRLGRLVVAGALARAERVDALGQKVFKGVLKGVWNGVITHRIHVCHIW